MQGCCMPVQLGILLCCSAKWLHRRFLYPLAFQWPLVSCIYSHWRKLVRMYRMVCVSEGFRGRRPDGKLRQFGQENRQPIY